MEAPFCACMSLAVTICARKLPGFRREMNCAEEQFHLSPIFKHNFEVSVGERVAPNVDGMSKGSNKALI